MSKKHHDNTLAAIIAVGGLVLAFLQFIDNQNRIVEEESEDDNNNPPRRSSPSSQ